MNKKAEFSHVLYVFLAVAGVLIIASLILILQPILKEVSNAIFPSIKSTVGNIPQINVTQETNVVVDTATFTVGMTDWLGGFAFMIAIISIFGLAISYKLTNSKILLGLWLALTIFIVLLSIIVSNFVQDFGESGGSYGEGIRNQSLLYFLLLNSPPIIIVVSLISGFIVFTGIKEEEEVF